MANLREEPLDGLMRMHSTDAASVAVGKISTSTTLANSMPCKSSINRTSKV